MSNSMIQKELESYVNNGSDAQLNAVLATAEAMGIGNPAGRQTIFIFITAFRNTLANGYIEYYKKVLKANPKLKSIMDFKVWCFAIYTNLARSGEMGSGFGLSVSRDTVEKYCKEYNDPNDYK